MIISVREETKGCDGWDLSAVRCVLVDWQLQNQGSTAKTAKPLSHSRYEKTIQHYTDRKSFS